MRGPRDPQKPQNFLEPQCPQLQMVVSSVVVGVGAVTHLEGAGARCTAALLWLPPRSKAWFRCRDVRPSWEGAAGLSHHVPLPPGCLEANGSEFEPWFFLCS